MTARRHFAFVQHLDPLRSLQGIHARYDCPDMATVDRHIEGLLRRIATAGARSPILADACRADIDQLLDRRTWLALASTA